MFSKCLKNLLLGLFFVTIVGLISCSNSFENNQGTVAISLPGAVVSTNAADRKAVQVDKNLLSYKLKLEGETVFEQIGTSGQTILFNDIPYGEYTLSVDAYGTDEVLYYSGKTQVTVESENTKALVALKYVGPQVNDETEITITITIDDEISDVTLFENTEIIIKTNENVTVEAPKGYELYYWFLDGEIISEKPVAEIEVKDFPNGKYILTLMVCDKAGNIYSQDLYLIVDIER